MQVVDDKVLPNGETEFYFNDDSYAYAKQQHNVAGAPWLKLGEWTENQEKAVITWSRCKFV